MVVLLAVPLAALSASSVASCASTETGDVRDKDASAVLQPPDAGGTIEDAGDAATPCEAGDPKCVSEVLSCEQADFCPVPSPLDRRYGLTAISGIGAADVWAVGSGGTILRWDGSAWKSVPSGTNETLHVVWASGPNDVWVAGSTATILRGPQWTPQPVFTTGTAYHGRVHALWGTSATDVRAGGQPFMQFDDTSSTTGNLLFRADGGWDVKEGLDGKYGQATINAIWGSSANDVWIAIDDGQQQPWARGTLVHGTSSSPGGPLAWTSIDSQSAQPFEAIWGSSAADVWAVGLGGTVCRFSAGAATWTSIAVPTTQPLRGVWGTSASDLWVVGDAGTILHFDGTTWTHATVAFPLGPKPNLTGVWGSGPNDVWVVGDVYTLHFTGKKVSK
jgi:hypothetical protein